MAKSREKKSVAKRRSPSGGVRGDDSRTNGIQTRLARVDEQILSLCQERARLVETGVLGTEGGAAVAAGADSAVAVASGLDEEGLLRLAQSAPGPLPERTRLAILRELHSGCRGLLRQLRVACLGPPYSYSHLASMRRFGQGVDFVPVGTIAAVFEEVHRGHSDFGLVPVENSTDGRIADTLDMLTRLPVRICGEVEMEIHHALLGKCPRTDVREVYSKLQPLSQCRNWLAKHLPAARTVEVTSTSTAAQVAGEKPGAAAIASIEAGVHYGLDVLAEKIEDNPSNTTRFAVIGGEPAPRTGNDRTAMLFQLEHRPGSLAEALGVFKRNHVNLTWLESFPIPGSDRAYWFFVEMDGHETDARLRRVVGALRRKTLRLEILGAFPVSRPIR